MNIVNEKIFVILWFWFAFLFIVTSVVLMVRIMHILMPFLRYRRLCELAPSTDRKKVKMLTSRIGQYFILFHIARNIKPHYFRDLIDLIVNEYFDDKCNVVYNKQAKSGQSLNQMSTMQQMGNQTKQKKGIKKTFGNKAKTGFVAVNRDPPSGHSQDSDEWAM